MWREYDDQGFLVNSFIETVSAIHPEYVMRMIGGLLYLSGALVMVYNIYRTIKDGAGQVAPASTDQPAAAIPAE